LGSSWPFASAKKVAEQTLAKCGRIDALLNIAGAVPQIDVLEMTDEQWDAGMALKLHGARRLTVEAWPALKASKGSVVLISGNSAIFPKAPYAAVGTINAAIVALAAAMNRRREGCMLMMAFSRGRGDFGRGVHAKSYSGHRRG